MTLGKLFLLWMLPGVPPPGPFGTTMVNASAYVNRNRLVIMGVCESELGPVPFTYHCSINGDVQDGPVNLSDESTNPAVITAIEESKGAIMKTIEDEKMKTGAEQLVLRARQGDENAMAMLTEIGSAAKNPQNPKARRALRLVHEFIEMHPAESAQVGALALPPPSSVMKSIDRNSRSKNRLHYSTSMVTLLPNVGRNFDDVTAAAILLANGPTLLCRKDIIGMANPRIKAIHDVFGHEKEKEAFAYGFTHSVHTKRIVMMMRKLSTEEVSALRVGHSVGLAQRIQAVRLDDTPIALLSRKAAWELGEEL